MGQNIVVPKRALISVFYKDGLEEFIPGLFERVPDIDILSSGGTANRIREIMGREDAVRDVSEYTGFPESPQGLVKTINPKISGGQLLDFDLEDHREFAEAQGILPIDMVVCGLYPHAETIAKPGHTIEEARHKIDIGGSLMTRACIKSYPRAFVLFNPGQYPGCLDELDRNGGGTSFDYRVERAIEALDAHVKYDAGILKYLLTRNRDQMRRDHGIEP